VLASGWEKLIVLPPFINWTAQRISNFASEPKKSFSSNKTAAGAEPNEPKKPDAAQEFAGGENNSDPGAK
jgi:hypothetical protein